MRIHASDRRPKAGFDSGMTLIEVMITLGVASGLLLGIMSLVEFSNKSVKNVSTNSEWNMFVASIEQAMVTNSAACNGAFAEFLYNASGQRVANAANALKSLSITSSTGKQSFDANTQVKSLFLNRLNPGGTGVSTPQTALLDTRPNSNTYGNSFRVTSFDLEADPKRWLDPPATMVIEGSSYQLRPILLFINGEKLPGPGGQNGTLGSQKLRNAVGIPLTIITGPNAGNSIRSCFSTQDMSQQACSELGGQYLPDGLAGNRAIKCVTRPAMFAGPNKPGTNANNSGGPPGSEQGMADGSVIQLSGATPGKTGAADWSIGIDRSNSQMWFNIGTATNANFAWHHFGGPAGDNYDAMKLKTRSLAGPNGTPIDGVELAIGTPTRGAEFRGAATLRFGSPVGGAESGTYIRSFRSSAAAPGLDDVDDLSFYTGNQPRFVLDRDGAAILRQRRPDLPAQLMLGDPTGAPGTPIFPAGIFASRNVATGSSDLQLATRAPLSGATPGGTSLALSDSAGISMFGGGHGLDFRVSSGDIAQFAIRSNEVSVTPVLRAKGGLALGETPNGGPAPGAPNGGGNVPYGCHSFVNQPPVMCARTNGETSWNCIIGCPAGEIAVSGGGKCDAQTRMWSNNGITYNQGGASDLVQNGHPNGWQIQCKKDADFKKPDMIYVYCCKI